MDQIVRANAEDAPGLADLYARGFEKTGFKEFALPERRDELIRWLRGLCVGGKVWFRCDEAGPVALGHYEVENDEIIIVVTRDGAERAGHATAVLKALVDLFPSANARPVTQGGKALAKKCGFSPSPHDQSLWVRAKMGTAASLDISERSPKP